MILGGQIAKAFDLFGPELLARAGGGIEIHPSRLGDRATLLGAIEGLVDGSPLPTPVTIQIADPRLE